MPTPDDELEPNSGPGRPDRATVVHDQAGRTHADDRHDVQTNRNGHAVQRRTDQDDHR